MLYGVRARLCTVNVRLLYGEKLGCRAGLPLPKECSKKWYPDMETTAFDQVVRPNLMEGLRFCWKPQNQAEIPRYPYRAAAIFVINPYGRKRENTGFESTDHQLTVDRPPTDSWSLSNTTHTATYDWDRDQYSAATTSPYRIGSDTHTHLPALC